MTIKKKYYLIGITALLICSAVIFFSRPPGDPHKGKIYLHAVPFQTASGWGYTVMAGEKIYIKQEFIPAISGKHYFQSEADAARVGNLVVKRVGSNQQPTITLGDLTDLGIIIK